MLHMFYYYCLKDIVQFRPRRATKITSTSSESKKSRGSKKSSSHSKRLFEGSESRKISDTLALCLKKNESFVNATEDCSFETRAKLATAIIENHKTGIYIL